MGNEPILVLQKYKSAKQWFWSGFTRYPQFMVMGWLLLLLNAFVSILPGILLGVGVDILVNSGVGPDLMQVCLYIIILAFVAWGTFSLGSYFWAIAAYRYGRDLRQEFFDVVQEQSMAFHDTNDSGKLLSMGMNEVNQMRFAFNPGLRMMLDTVTSFVLTIVYFYIRIQIGCSVIGVGYWQIGLIITIGFIFYTLFAIRYTKTIRPIRKELSKELGIVSSISQEVFRGIEVVRSFNNELQEKHKFETVSQRLSEKIEKEGKLSAFYWPALILILILGFTFGYGMFGVSQEILTYGQLTAMLTLLIQLSTQNVMIPRRLLVIQAGMVNAQRIWDVMNFSDPLEEPKERIQPNWESDLTFDDVSFRYPGTERDVLQNISIKIPSGSRVAIIGGPGSGKSTFLKLLLRLYDPTEGKILLGQNSFRNMHTYDIRQDVVLVEQEIFLFKSSLRENIQFSCPDASEEEIRTAASKAQIADFIESTPKGYDTLIGERGVTLSGGQKQRIAIARALLANPKLLLLDDSTSAVDILTEIQIRKAIEELIKGRTSIFVTQRLSTLITSDMIIFLSKNQILDVGTHEQLIHRCNEYQEMIRLLPMGTQLLDSLQLNQSTDINSIGGDL